MEKLKPIEHKFKALFFRLFQSFLTNRASAEIRPLDATRMKRVIIFRPDRLGDMIVTLPLVDGLKKHFPHLEISILASPKNLPLIKDDPRFAHIFIYTKSVWRDIEELFKIRQMKFDCVIDTIFEDSVSSLFLANFCAAKAPVVGMGKQRYKLYYTFNFGNSAGHIADNTIKLLESFGIDSPKLSRYADPYLNSVSSVKTTEFLKQLKSGSEFSPIAGLNLSSGAPSRVWPMGKWIELIRKASAHMPELKVVLITVPSERETAISVKSEFSNGVYMIPDQMGISEVAAIIKRLDILISPDTSLVHLARVMQVPVIGLYTGNAKNFNLWHPYGMKEHAISAASNDNIFDITVEQVTNKLVSLLNIRQEVRS